MSSGPKIPGTTIQVNWTWWLGTGAGSSSLTVPWGGWQQHHRNSLVRHCSPQQYCTIEILKSQRYCYFWLFVRQNDPQLVDCYQHVKMYLWSNDSFGCCMQHAISWIHVYYKANTALSVDVFCTLSYVRAQVICHEENNLHTVQYLFIIFTTM